MTYPSRPTSTFLLLLLIAAGVSYSAIRFTDRLRLAPSSLVQDPPSEAEQVTKPVKQPLNLDTTTWKDYIDREYFLTFKYPPTWQVQTYPARAGYYIIVLKPDTGADNIRIYVSPNDYFAMQGLPYETETLAGARALNVNDMLVGVRFAAQYYTFTLGTDTSLQPHFQKILSTVAFSR